MAKGDTKTNDYLDIAAHGDRVDFPASCCETRSQTLIREVGERIMDLEDEVERLENNPDVADIVATYADLQSYDTSQLTDKDVIRVLQDETHDGDSTYYRYNKQTDTWTYIGESKQYTNFVGTDGTTAGEAGLVPAPATTDAGKFLSASGLWEEVAAGGGITELTSADYNYPADNPNGVALWLLDAGVYVAKPGVTWYYTNNSTLTDGCAILKSGEPGSNSSYIISQERNGSASVRSVYVNANGQPFSSGDTTLVKANTIVDNLTSASASSPLSAAQGKVLKDFIGDLTNLTTTDKTNLVAAINEAAAGGGGGPTVVQTTGTSTTDVMSQNAVTSMVFADPSTKTKVNIGGLGAATNSIAIGKDSFSGENNSGYGSVAIGTQSNTYGGTNSVAVGTTARARAVNAVSIGYYAGHATTDTQYNGAISLGAYSEAHARGEMNIGSTDTTFGYNNSNYRLLTGLYDGQNAHDAATVGQAVGTTETYTIATSDWTALSSSSPYDYQTTVTATYTIGNSTVAELLNDNPVAFATNGFAIGSISGQSVTIYSIGQPSASTTLKINYKG